MIQFYEIVSNQNILGCTYVVYWRFLSIKAEAIYTSDIKHASSIKGRQMWLDLNEYVVLTENTRYMHDTTPLMNVFLSGARKGIVNQEL